MNPTPQLQRSDDRYPPALSFFLLLHRAPRPALFPYTTLFRSHAAAADFTASRPRPSTPAAPRPGRSRRRRTRTDRKSTRLNSSHVEISYAVFCLKKKKTQTVDLGPAYQMCQVMLSW